MSIETQAKNIMRKAIVKLSKEHSVSCKEVQLMLRMEEGKPKFFATKQFVPEREMTVKELYPVLVDVLHVRQLLPAFVGSLLVDTAEECNAENWEDIKIFIFTMDDDAKDLHIFAYNKNEKYKALDWSIVFGDEAMMRVMTKHS